MLQIIFGDDEHTAADGPYVRLMKTRKWLYLSSAAGLVLANGLYDSAAAKDLLKVLAAPVWMLAPALSFGLTYLITQYALLLVQLGSIYDLVVSDRLQTRRVEDLAAARERIKETEAELHEALKSAASNNIKISQITDEIRRLKRESGDDQLTLLRERTKDVATRQSVLEGLERDLSSAKVSDFSSLVDSSRSAAVQAVEAFKKLQNENPANRPGYRSSEYAIDLLRVLPPAMFSLYAFSKLLEFAFPDGIFFK